MGWYTSMRPRFPLNNPNLKDRRQTLRNEATPAEKALWSRLKNNQLGCKFRRQHSFDFYIVDFYCPEKKLAIELDGSSHKFRREYDSYRTRYLDAFNVKVLRFWNSQIENDIDWVINEIKKYIPS